MSPSNTQNNDSNPKEINNLPVPLDERSCTMHNTPNEKSTAVRITEFLDSFFKKPKDAEVEKPQAEPDGGYGGATHVPRSAPIPIPKGKKKE
ncbi:hypothetical protein NPX13_g2502 [Xylaria arbuscula]|uniref:Uncharacterized protein n=1 Tax=Xylaria arbuscula TaxID=114810 RepID=A0A9W8NKC8_9PEZI|nr:hypothetical protein NPX13_g2502 [Xylaria arbuscula]